MKHISKVGRLFICLLVLVGAILTMAPTPCNLRIGEYPGGSEKQGREGTSDVFAIDHEMVQPIDLATGAASSVRQHRPFTVLMVIDKATPGLHKALSTGQNLKQATIDFYRIDPASRAEAKYYVITLRNVRIVGIKTMMPTSFVPENESFRHMEEVRMVYEEIEWNWLPDSIIEMDKWQGPRAIPAAAQSTFDNNTQPAGVSTLTKPSSSLPRVAPPMDTSTAKQNAPSDTTKK